MSQYGMDNPPYYISAYALACKRGFVGSLDDWLASLKGEKGDTGKSAYQYAVEGGYQGTEESFSQNQANPGKTAYEYAVEGGYKGSAADFAVKLAQECLSRAGGTMNGEIAMGGFRISWLGAPENENDAVTKKYVDGISGIADEARRIAQKALPKEGGTINGELSIKGELSMGGNRISGVRNPEASADAVPKSYVDGKRFIAAATISTAWEGNAAPYRQLVSVPGVLASDFPHISPVYSDNYETAVEEREVWNMIHAAASVDGAITFVCFEEKPTTAITVLIEVIR